jgi:predicted nucleic acid-binding protein
VKVAFIDTSAFLAALDKDDRFHEEAATKWAVLAKSRTELWTTD